MTGGMSAGLVAWGIWRNYTNGEQSVYEKGSRTLLCASKK